MTNERRGDSQRKGGGFFRNGLDIVLLIAFSAAIAPLMQMVIPEPYASDDYTLVLLIPILSLAFIWMLVAVRGQKIAEIGIKSVDRPAATVALGIVIAVCLFGFALFVESLGLERDFSTMRAKIEGNLPYTLFLVGYAFVGPGLYEETTFRGFVMQRIAHMFGGERAAWAAAAVLQGVLFGLVHAHQGPGGMLFTGGVSIVLAFFLLAIGRNLWPLIIGHGLYDAARFVYFYFLWT